jgi:hypothetical protein
MVPLPLWSTTLTLATIFDETEPQQGLHAACDLQFLLPSNEKTSKTMHHCSVMPATFNCSNLETNEKTSKTQCEKLGVACDLQRILSLNENTSKTMHHCSALPATFNCYCHSIRKTSKMNHCSALPATFNWYFHQTIKP